MHVIVNSDPVSAEHSLRSATALFGLAATQTGSSIAQLERGEIALAELVEGIAETTAIAVIELRRAPSGYVLTLAFAEQTATPPLDGGARQIIDATFDHWTLDASSATISIGVAHSPTDRG